jgi:hypothetical protein
MAVQTGLTPTRGNANAQRAAIRDVLGGLLAGRAGIRRGQMFGNPAFFTGGKLFACVYDGGVGLKLPVAMAQGLIGAPGIAAFEPYGKATMKSWVHICRAAPEDYAGDRELVLTALEHVRKT